MQYTVYLTSDKLTFFTVEMIILYWTAMPVLITMYQSVRSNKLLRLSEGY